MSARSRPGRAGKTSTSTRRTLERTNAFRRAASLLAAVSALALAGCGERSPGAGGRGGPAPGATDTIVLQLNWVPEPEFGGVYAADVGGAFAEAGLDVDVRAGGVGIPTAQAVATGRVDYAVLGGTQLLQFNDRLGPDGLDSDDSLVAVFAIFQRAPHAIMVPADGPHDSIASLWRDPEATIALESELPYVAVLDAAYERRAALVPYDAVAFRAGRVQGSQCFVFAEPVTLELDDFATRVFPIADAGFDSYDAVVVTTRGRLRSDPDGVRAFVVALQKGWRDYLADPDPVNRVMHELNPAMSLEAMALAAERQRPFVEGPMTAALGPGAMVADRWRETVAMLARVGRLDRDPTTLVELADRSFAWLPAAPDTP